MFCEILIPLFINFLIHNSLYTSLYNSIIISISSLLKVILYNNYYIHIFLQITSLSSILYYFIDTIILLYNKKINVFILHHICAIYLFSTTYIFDYNIYIIYVLLFLMEISSVSYNLFCYKFITINTHKFIYIPFRTVSNILFIYYILYCIKWTYYIEYYLYIISYILLFILSFQ